MTVREPYVGLTDDVALVVADEDYKKHQYEDGDNERSMQGLRWDGAAVRKVGLCVFVSVKEFVTKTELH